MHEDEYFDDELTKFELIAGFVAYLFFNIILIVIASGTFLLIINFIFSLILGLFTVSFIQVFIIMVLIRLVITLIFTLRLRRMIDDTNNKNGSK